MSIWLWVLIISCVILLHILYNETILFWKENDDFQPSDETRLFNPGCAGIHINKGKKSAVLCVHGFPAAPSNYQYFVPELARHFDVYVPLLPGMGTRPGDMRGQTFSGWYRFVREQYLKIRKKYRTVYLLGISMGGSLCLKLSQEFNTKSGRAPDAMALCSAPVFINSLFENGVLHRPLLYFSRTLSVLLPTVIPHSSRTPQMEDNGHVWLGYHAFFLKQIHSLKMGLKKIRRGLDRIDCPLYLTHSKRDKTVPFQNLNYIMSHVSSPHCEKRVVDTSAYNHTHHVLFIYDSVRDLLFHDIIDFFKRMSRSHE